MPEQFSSISVRVEAMKLTKDNLEEAAIWCGGRAVHEEKPTANSDVFSYLLVPHLDGRLEVSLGMYLIKNRDTGDFYPLTAGAFESRFAKPTRQEPFISRGSGHPLEVSLDADEYVSVYTLDPEYTPEPPRSRFGFGKRQPGAKQI